MATLEDALAEWLEAAENGQAPDKESFCRRYPEVADELYRNIELDERFRAKLQVMEDPNGQNTCAHSRARGGLGCDSQLELDLEDYEVYERIGGGGQGDVHRAKHLGLDVFVAIKILRHPDFTAEEKERHLRDARILAQLNHPNVVHVFDVGEHNGIPYFSLEHVEGGSLDRKLNERAMSPREAATMVAKLARAMHQVHQEGILHRDLKPANVLMTSNGEPKLTDFGLAKKLDEAGQTRTGAFVGTVSYASPEATCGDSRQLTQASDVYGLGAILYECLTGHAPFKGADVVDTIRQVRELDPVPPRETQPSVPRDLETICLKCLEKDPTNRYATAAELADDLDRYLNHESIMARGRGWFGVLRRRRFINTRAWGKKCIASAINVSLCHVTFYFLIRYQGPAALFYLSFGAHAFLSFMILHWKLPKGRDLDPAEKIVISLWPGVFLGVFANWIAFGSRIDDSLLTTWYPALAVLTGVAYFLHGLLFWGYYYLIGIAFMALAVAMRFTPMHWAPLGFAALFFLCTGGIGAYLIWYSRSEDPIVQVAKDRNVAE